VTEDDASLQPGGTGHGGDLRGEVVARVVGSGGEVGVHVDGDAVLLGEVEDVADVVAAAVDVVLGVAARPEDVGTTGQGLDEQVAGAGTGGQALLGERDDLDRDPVGPLLPELEQDVEARQADGRIDVDGGAEARGPGPVGACEDVDRPGADVGGGEGRLALGGAGDGVIEGADDLGAEHRLVEVQVGLDQTRQDEAPGAVEDGDSRAPFEVRPLRGDAAAGDGDVAGARGVARADVGQEVGVASSHERSVPATSSAGSWPRRKSRAV